jgi:Mrp family chromosome partitioning ATPase
MSISFGETLTKAKESFDNQAILPKLKAITLIRDVYGKIHLYLEPVSSDHQPSSEEIEDLRAQLKTNLGSYFGEDIWLADQNKDVHRSLGRLVIAQRVAAEWDQEGAVPRWYVLERHISKKAWTSRRAGRPPWDFDLAVQGHKAKIVSFFSFKGGMGRTTALVATALTMARQGYRIAIVDLDLEAPGLASIFFGDLGNSTGVTDYLIEKRIQKREWKLHNSVQLINSHDLLGDEGETIYLLPAGVVNHDYLEKLARLDFQHLMDQDHNLVELLQQMLSELDRIYKPLDFIFVDARAGFHDIGGLAVADLSHASVLFGNNSQQTWVGLEQVIRRLARHDEGEPQSMLLAHAMAPPLGLTGREEELQQFREKAYDTFMEHYYSSSTFSEFDLPNSNDPDAAFTPIVFPWREAFRGDLALYLREETPSEKERVASLVQQMTDQAYQELAKRICFLFGEEFQRKQR